ncbi:MAG: amidase [Methyloligellaceae bacterium]
MAHNKAPDIPYSGPDLCRMEAHVIVDLLKSRKVSPDELLKAAFERIEQVEPDVNAMPITCRELAETKTSGLDESLSGHPGYLAGLPIAIKDLTPVKDVLTTFGTLFMKDYIPEESDAVVSTLEERGGVVVGKTNTPEFGAGGNTFNPVFGATRNPWDTQLNAGGSSGGAAVSLATGEVWLSHGSDHGGSLRTPAAYNGIVGLRPSSGICGSSTETTFHLEAQQGPMARSVRDCALFLDAMAGFQKHMPTSYPAPETPYQNAALTGNTKVRIGFSPDLGGLLPVEPEMDSCLRNGLLAIEKNGGSVEEVNLNLSKLVETYYTFRRFMWATKYRRVSETFLKGLKPVLAEDLALGKALAVDDIADAELNRMALFRKMVRIFDQFDVLACPVVGSMPRAVETEWVGEINGQKLNGYMDWLGFAFLATVTGLPAMSVPAGFSADGIPVGIQLIGPPRGEAKLIEVARAVEMAVGGPFKVIDPKVMHRDQ